MYQKRALTQRSYQNRHCYNQLINKTNCYNQTFIMKGHCHIKGTKKLYYDSHRYEERTLAKTWTPWHTNVYKGILWHTKISRKDIASTMVSPRNAKANQEKQTITNHTQAYPWPNVEHTINMVRSTGKSSTCKQVDFGSSEVTATQSKINDIWTYNSVDYHSNTIWVTGDTSHLCQALGFVECHWM